MITWCWLFAPRDRRAGPAGLRAVTAMLVDMCLISPRGCGCGLAAPRGLANRWAQQSALADSQSPGRDEVGDDERGREEEQAEDEVPDEAVALAASDPGGPERDRDPDDSEQDPPQDRHDMSPSAFRAERLYLLPD